MTELTSENYDPEVSGISRALILCYKDQCPHCMNVKKVITKYQTVNKDDIVTFMLNSEKESSLMEKFDAELVPTTIFIKNGEIVHKKVGLYNPKELRSMMQDNLP